MVTTHYCLHKQLRILLTTELSRLGLTNTSFLKLKIEKFLSLKNGSDYFFRYYFIS
jgi:hypothetical protein